jgi:peptidoglycan/LPS O-acetylase OafA/YrhL
LNRSDQKASIPFRADIEGLRALAVGLVIASHAGLPFLRGGFVGVDVFFLLSGYLITNLLMQELSSSGTVNLARFYARRARRLLPAAITMVMVVCGAEAIIMNPVAQFKTLKAALAMILYSSYLYSRICSCSISFINVKVLDLSDLMCGPDRCYLEVRGQIIYRDADHLTATFSRSRPPCCFSA